jgi:lipopolysaccharide cholinephosphotransferase
MTDEDIDRLHRVLLDMYKDINAVCKRNNIGLIAAGGTQLGAIRHHGFIPWDDDMDIFIFRSDFERFKDVFISELSDKYYLLDPGSDKGANCFLPRIMKKGTTLLGMIDEASPYPHGIYIDINIIEYASEFKLAFIFKALIVDTLRLISYSVYWHQYKSESFKKYMLNSKGAYYYRIRMAIGRLFSFKSAEIWFKLFDRYAQHNKKSRRITVPSGTKKYMGESLLCSIVIPLKTVEFEDTEINVFNNFDYYLRNLYGDYMIIPEKKYREQHLCLKLDFDKEL